MIHRAYYADAIEDFLKRPSDEILGALTRSSAFAIEATQRDAWITQTEILQRVLSPYRGRGKVYLHHDRVKRRIRARPAARIAATWRHATLFGGMPSG